MLFLLAQPLPIVPEVDKPFMSGEGERRQSRICRSTIRRKKFPTQGRGYSIGIPKNLLSIISDAFHVYFALLLNL